jgi:hypothetical protein
MAGDSTPIEVCEVWAWCLCVVGYAMWQVLLADLTDARRLADWQAVT